MTGGVFLCLIPRKQGYITKSKENPLMSFAVTKGEKRIC